MQVLEIYVKATSNTRGQGLPLTRFSVLSPTWTGEQVRLPIGATGKKKTVVGWDDAFHGIASLVHIVRVRAPGGEEGYLVYGHNSGVRILDATAEVIPGLDDHLPRGYGRPLIWVEALADLPPAVQKIVQENLDATSS